VDKILISSIYSSSDLSFYYTANAFGKILLTALGPLSGLILSYLVGYRKIETASFIKILVILFVISIPGFFVSYYLSDFFIFYFYKSIYVQTKSLLFFATISSIISFFIIMINPFVIKFKSLRMLFLVNFFSFIFSLFFSIYLGSLYNILGFTIGIAFSNFIRLILTIILFIFF
jgi:O-antigen/teichoic acid export membrane protein